MGLTMRERQAVTRELAPRYQRGSKKQKGCLLDEFVALTGYHRTYASFLLRHWGRRLFRRINGELVLLVLGAAKPKGERDRTRIYPEQVVCVLRKLWWLADCICGKRLAPLLPELIAQLEKFGELKLALPIKRKLFRISPATIDRLLAPEKKKLALKGRARTKPGTLLKQQIPIRTFSEWNEHRPGFVEVDLVSHDGGNAGGEFAYTLDLTDVCTGWTETQAVKNRAQQWVFDAVREMRQQLPFPLLGLDSDNDSAFINHHLVRYCRHQQITFTRSRPQRKNDNCFVEQKNYSVVRRAVGYARYDTEEEVQLLNHLYRHLRLYTNFFQPVMKLQEKIRCGSKVTKKYDTAQTPYQRLLKVPQIANQNKLKLHQLYATLNPAALKRNITTLQNRLGRVVTKKRKHYKDLGDFGYNSTEATQNRFVKIFT